VTRAARWTTTLAIVTALWAADAALVARDRAFPRGAITTHAVWPVDTVRRFLLTFQGVASDVYWIRAIQHFGRERRLPPASGRYAQLYPLIDRATDFDPRFVAAYQFGALFLAEPAPAGAGRLDHSIALLEKGRRALPDRWQFVQYLGIIHYWHGPDRRVAARYFEEAAAMPGGPAWLRPLAAAAFVDGGDVSAARAVLESLRQHDQAWLRELAQQRLNALEGR
jgi:hypothetical protein